MEEKGLRSRITTSNLLLVCVMYVWVGVTAIFYPPASAQEWEYSILSMIIVTPILLLRPPATPSFLYKSPAMNLLAIGGIVAAMITGSMISLVVFSNNHDAASIGKSAFIGLATSTVIAWADIAYYMSQRRLRKRSPNRH